MDLDGDGIDDVISGSYWPGELYFFKGLGNGQYAPGEVLQDAEGRNLIASEPWESENQHNMASLASVPFAFDYNGNGVLDLLVGNIEGRVILIPNIGTREEPQFCAEQRIPLIAGGEEIRVGGGDAGPVMVDWDGDGLEDLLVGAGDGSVWFYRNAGSRGAPEFEKGAQLIPPSNREFTDPDEDGKVYPKGPGTRTKVHAVDFNGNGRLDLLVGDFISVPRTAPQLTEEQIERRDELQAKRRELSQQLNDTFRRIVEELGGEEIPRTLFIDNEELRAIQEQMREVSIELQRFLPGMDNAGFVWLYLRREAADTETSSN